MTDRLELLDDPQIRPFLPLLYVAWVDGELDAEQRRAIESHLTDRPWLRPVARNAIVAWLDPSDPPTPTELAAVQRTIERASRTLMPESRRTLAALAGALAEENASVETRQAAQRIAEILQVAAIDPAAEGLAPVESVGFEEVALDVAALQRVLDGEHAEVRDRIRRFIASPERRVYGLPPSEYRPLVSKWLRELAEIGVGDLALPKHVGADARPDMRPFIAAFQMLAHGDLSLLVKSGVQFGLFGGSVYFLGTGAHHELVPKIASIELPGCFAMSEAGHGSNVSDLETTARYDHATRTLEIHSPSESSRKEWIGGAAHDARMATVFAQLEVNGEHHGVHAILVPIRDVHGNVLEGVRVGDSGLKMGLNGVDNGRLWFENVRVPVGNLLDRFAHIDASGNYQSPISSAGKRFFKTLGTLVGGRVSVACASVAIAQTGLAIAIRYATTRRQFGPSRGREVPLIVYPSHQRRLFPALAKSYVLHFALGRLRDEFAAIAGDHEADTRELEAQAAGLKALATWHATQTIQQCREACGGQGYLAVNRIADLKADSDVFTTFEGDNTVLLQLTAKSLLTRFGKQLEDGGVAAMLRMVGKIALDKAIETTSVRSRDTSSTTLRSREFQRAAFAHREERLVRTAALRMRKRLGADMDPHHALLEVQEHLLAAARAYIENLMLRWFDEATSTLEEGESKTWIDRLGTLFALSTIESGAAWYLEDGYLDGGNARDIRKEVEALLEELVPAARHLVDAFGIPDACLAAPIAFHDPARSLEASPESSTKSGDAR